MFGANHFGVVDYIVLVLTLLLSISIGVYHAYYGAKTKEEILVGGRKMRIVPVAISMLATQGRCTPTERSIFSWPLPPLFFIPLGMVVFVRVFYEMKLTSVYEYLERRFDSIWIRWLASFTFILQILLVSGVNLFAPSIALEAILGFPVWFSITAIGVIGTVYTALGGIRAVIWTDVFQFIMIMVGLGAIVIKGFINAGGIGQAFEKAGDKDRLELFNWSVDPYMRHNTLNFVVGSGFLLMTMYGTHQPLVQRYSSLPSATAAMKTFSIMVPLSFLLYVITILTGICAVATYAGCDPILLGKIFTAEAIIPYFVVEELSFIPGMTGIFVSCIFSAVLSSVSSALNSLAAVTWEDFLSKIPFFKKMDMRGQAISTKVLSAMYGAISIGLAFLAQSLGTIFQVAATSVGATSGPFGGIFLCGLFLPYMNKYGAVGGMLTGLGSMLFIAAEAFDLGRKHVLYPRMPTDLSECPADTDFSDAKNFTSLLVPEFDYPTKLYTTSYLLYPIVGGLITAIVGTVISLFTGGFGRSHTVEEKYIHPWIKGFGWVERFTKSETRDKAIDKDTNFSKKLEIQIK